MVQGCCKMSGQMRGHRDNDVVGKFLDGIISE